jgi:hypothetical protein
MRSIPAAHLLALGLAMLTLAAPSRAAPFVELVTVDQDAAVWVITTDAAAAVEVRVQGGEGALEPVVDVIEQRFHMA